MTKEYLKVNGKLAKRSKTIDEKFDKTDEILEKIDASFIELKSSIEALRKSQARRFAFMYVFITVVQALLFRCAAMFRHGRRGRAHDFPRDLARLRFSCPKKAKPPVEAGGFG